jgi:two-component system NtrC family sensor kinase
MTLSFITTKRRLKILFIILLPVFVYAQNGVDSLRNIFTNATDGAPKHKAARDIYNYFEERNRDSALHYAEISLSIARKHGIKIPEAYSLSNEAYQLIGLGRYAEALQCLQQAFAIVENREVEKEKDWNLALLSFSGNKRLLVLSYTHHIFAILMLRTENLEQQIIHFKEAARIGSEIGYAPRVMLADMNLGQSYLTANKPDSALFFEKKAEQETLQSGFHRFLSTVYQTMGDIYEAMGDHSVALDYYYRGLQSAAEENNLSTLSRIYLRLTKYHLAKGDRDSTLYYARKNFQTIQSLGSVAGLETNLGIGYQYLSLGFKLNGQFDSAFKYQGLALSAKDSLNSRRIKNLTAFQNLTFNEKLRAQDLEKEKVVYQNKVRIYFLMAGIGVLLLLAVIFYRNNRQKHKTNIVLEKTLSDLKATQTQLIQSEKMASLGELTAGIAHEIQNPLNFVNNFSELNSELIAEMKQEIEKHNYEDAKLIANNVDENQQKINVHGKRADAIVKGMLQHSRSSSGVKEPTDINALADEYLRLAYHGLRAKDKSFNATMKTDFEETVGNVRIIPQDIGRVILNLITNAFYAVTEKKKQKPDGYEPTIFVSTKKINDKIEIRVADNGNGIPQKVLDKIFQPFFTTKPTGEGTGLGLSLSYDIVTKGHGGDLKVKNKEGEGAEFIIILPDQL